MGTVPPWVKAASAVVGLAIIAAQAALNALDGRAPNTVLLVVGGVMIGIVSPDAFTRMFGGTRGER